MFFRTWVQIHDVQYSYSIQCLFCDAKYLSDINPLYALIPRQISFVMT